MKPNMPERTGLIEQVVSTAVKPSAPQVTTEGENVWDKLRSALGVKKSNGEEKKKSSKGEEKRDQRQKESDKFIAKLTKLDPSEQEEIIQEAALAVKPNGSLYEVVVINGQIPDNEELLAFIVDASHKIAADDSPNTWNTIHNEFATLQADGAFSDCKEVAQQIRERILLKTRGVEINEENLVNLRKEGVGSPAVPAANNGQFLAQELFGDIDLSLLPPSDQQWVQDRINLLSNDPRGVNPDLLTGWAHQLQDRIRGIQDPSIQLELSNGVASLSEKIRNAADENRIPSTIMLTHEEARRIIEDPVGFMEGFISEISELMSSQNFDSPIIEQRLQRYRLITDFFASHAYEAQIDQKMSVSLNQLNVIDRQEVMDMQKKLLKSKTGILEQYSNQLHALEFSYALSNISDFEHDSRFPGLLDRIGESGAFGTRSRYGGLSERMVQKIRLLHEQALNNPETGEHARSLPQTMKKVIDQAVGEMVEEWDLWEPQLNFYVKRLSEQANEVDIYIKPTQFHDKEKVARAIAQVAASSYQMMFEKEEVMMKGLSCAENAMGGEGANPFVTANMEERITWAFRFRDFFRKWTNLIPGQRAMWNERARFYINKDPELQAWATERTNSLFERLESSRGKWSSLPANGKLTGENSDPLFVELKTVFSEYEHKELEWGGQSDKELVNFFLSLSKKKLQHYVEVDIGGEWSQLHALKTYGFWGSGVRRGEIYHQIEKDNRYKGLAKQLFQAKGVIDKANAHFHPGLKFRSSENKNEFVKKLRETVVYHPLTYMQLYLNEHRIEMKNGLGPTEGKIFKEATRRFDMIQSHLMLNAEAPIDYRRGLGGLSREQRELVDQVFDRVKATGEFTLSKEAYFEKMKGYIDDVMKKTSDMEDFAHVRYVSAFSTLLWTDDIPLAGMQMPTLVNVEGIAGEAERSKILKDAYEGIPLAQKIVESGRGRNGLWRRAWGDFTIAQSLVQAEIDTLNPDSEVFMKAIKLLNDKISLYSGSNDAAIAVLEATAGYLSSAGVKKNYSEFFKSMKNSSILKEFWGDKAPSLALDELSEFYDKEEAIVGALRHVAPVYEELMKDYVNITRWRHSPLLKVITLGGENGVVYKMIGKNNYEKMIGFLNENVPLQLYLYKSRNVALFGMILMFVIISDQAKKGGEEGLKH